MKFKEDTPELLRMYFGLVHGRSVKKSVLCNELVRRGVSPWSVEEAVHALLFAIGHAADNCIEEIDVPNEGVTRCLHCNARVQDEEVSKCPYCCEDWWWRKTVNYIEGKEEK